MPGYGVSLNCGQLPEVLRVPPVSEMGVFAMLAPLSAYYTESAGLADTATPPVWADIVAKVFLHR